MATRTTAVGTKADTDILSGADFNDAAGGWIGYVAVTSSQSSITTSATDLTSLSVSPTVGSSRYIKLTGQCRFVSDVATDDFSLNIQESTTVLNGGGFCGQRLTVNYMAHVQAVLANPSSGSHTYKLTGGRSGGTGNITMVADATHPAWLLVEDIGST